MCKQRRCANEVLSCITVVVAGPRIPGFRSDGIGGRSDSKQIDDRELAVEVPPDLQKAFLWSPAMTQQKGMTVQHPLEIDPLVDQGGEAADLLIALKV